MRKRQKVIGILVHNVSSICAVLCENNNKQEECVNESLQIWPGDQDDVDLISLVSTSPFSCSSDHKR